MPRLPRLTDLAGSVNPMPALAAAGFLMSGAALLALTPPATEPAAPGAPAARPGTAGSARRQVGQLLALAVTALGRTVLAGYATGRTFGIDRLLPAGMLPAGPQSGRPASATAAVLLVAGADHAAAGRRPPGVATRPATVLSVLTGVLALSTALGYLYGVPYLRGGWPGTGGWRRRPR
ncbi:MAG TPA: hypothetical protein VLJ59_10565 [Mycobacteriales bacterium]|nr:hypothetical protein [Mycobacteriales bacterium]